jgi:copper oxidase (laccase) domain-containing protein
VRTVEVPPEFITPVLFFDRARVNIDDLLHSGWRGGIVRCQGDPDEAITVISAQPEAMYEYIAGMISENP